MTARFIHRRTPRIQTVACEQISRRSRVCSKLLFNSSCQGNGVLSVRKNRQHHIGFMRGYAVEGLMHFEAGKPQHAFGGMQA
jgi:hypothetical protein